MISITCTNCQSVLTIDDAFAGGVCRCQFCGTIQTVPSKKRSTAHLAGATTAKTLYQQESPASTKAAEPEQGTGMDDLAEAVAASSGLAGSGLVNKTAEPPAEAPPSVAVESPPLPADEGTRTRLPVVLITAAAVVLAGVVAIIIWLRIAPSSVNGPTKLVGPVVSGPSFCGVPLAGNSVIFILDRGNSMADSFDATKAACYKSLKQLGPDRKFQVILWDIDAGSAEFPAGAMRNATAGAIEDCQRDFQDTSAGGRSHLSGPLREAVERHPQAIIIATGKLQLDEDDTTALHAPVGTGIHVSVVQIANPTHTPQLEELTKSTGGLFKQISAEDLKELAR